MKHISSLVLAILFCSVPSFGQYDGENHLNGIFKTHNFTWNDTHLPGVELKYNHGDAPGGTTPYEMEILIAIALSEWEYMSSLHRVEFVKHPIFSTTEKNSQDTTNVIYWTTAESFVQAEVIHNPDQDPGQGPKSEVGADIYFNNHQDVLWHFGSSPPAGRDPALYGYDFVETLMHELGHVIGLRHTDSYITEAIMQGNYENRTVSLRSFSDGDRAGAFFQHPTLSMTSLDFHSAGFC